jgi:hypothetical protein
MGLNFDSVNKVVIGHKVSKQLLPITLASFAGGCLVGESQLKRFIEASDDEDAPNLKATKQALTAASN